MLHIDEELLERYVINPVSLDKLIREKIQDHIFACKTCRTLYNYLAGFYREYYTTAEIPSPVVREFLSGLYPVIELSELRLQPDEEPHVYITVLAAMSDVQTNDRFVSVATLASEEQNAVVRILEDTEREKLKIYVITEDPQRRSHAILSFPDIATDFVTDNRGQLEVKFPKSNWKQLKGLLRLAVSHYELSSEDTKRISGEGHIAINGPLHRVIVAYKDQNLDLYIEEKKSYGPKLQLTVITSDNGVTYFVPLEKGHGQYTIRRLPASMTLRLYC